MESTAQNAGEEYVNGRQARPVFSFKADAASNDDDDRDEDGDDR